MPAVTPEILKWARDTAGLSLDEAAKGILRDAHGKTAAQRLAELEAGDIEPSRVILNKMAKKYSRPLITFYLTQPPAPSDRGEDFRTLPQPIDKVLDANLNALLRKVKASQEIVRDLLEDEESEALKFIGSATLDQKPEHVANEIITAIGFEIKKFRAYQKDNDAFEYLRSKVHDAGIFVILAQDSGNPKKNIPLDVFRGFVIADEIAPFIIINDGDAISAKSFTLLHELSHLWLGTTGISGDIRTPSNNIIEVFCNKVAALILLDQEEMVELRKIQYAEFDEIVNIISSFAKERNISRSMVAYKLFLDKQITNNIWQRLSNKFHEEWRDNLRIKKEKEGRKAGGPNYYVVRRNKLGQELMGLASRAMSAGLLTPSKASIVLLGVKPGNVHELVSNIHPKGIS